MENIKDYNLRMERLEMEDYNSMIEHERMEAEEMSNSASMSEIEAAIDEDDDKIEREISRKRRMMEYNKEKIKFFMGIVEELDAHNQHLAKNIRQLKKRSTRY